MKRRFRAQPGEPYPLGATVMDGGVNFSVFSRNATAVELLARAGVGLLVYVLLKPIDTGEREAIEDSVVTARKVFALGRELKCRTRVGLEPCFVAPQTPLYHAFEQGRYRPPWLWSVVEAVSRVASLGHVLVGLSDEGINSLQSPHNCEHCTGRFRQALAALREEPDVVRWRQLLGALKKRAAPGKAGSENHS